MKNLLRSACAYALLLTSALLPRLSAAQALPSIPGAGFENWSARTTQGLGGPITYQAPDGWDAGFFSALTAAFGMPPRFERSTTAHSGAASLRINVGADSTGADLITSFGVNRAPAGLTLWARNSVAFADPEDAGFVLLFFTRSRPGGGADTVAVGGGGLYTTVPNTWQQVGIPIIPVRAQTPDSVLIYLYNIEGFRANYQTFVDDLAFTNNPPMGTRDAANTAGPLTLSANPVSAGTGSVPYLTVPARVAGRAALTVTDILGREAGRVRLHDLRPGDNQLAVPVGGLSAGTYVVRVVSAEGTRSTRLVVQ